MKIPFNPEQFPALFQKLRTIDPNEKVVYCKKCVMSNQRPRIQFNEDGTCGQCLYHEYKRTSINWDKREKELEQVCDKFRSKDGSWDVIVPGSGGKDSMYVAYMLREKYGMHPLTVTSAPAMPTEIGRKNFEKFTSQFDNILVSPQGNIHRKFSQLTFAEFGDNLLPFVYGQLHIPQQIAVKFKIPLIMFGENGDPENGGSLKTFNKSQMDIGGEDYSLQFMRNLTPEYSSKNLDFDIKELRQRYMPPSKEDMNRLGVQEHFFSYYYNWKATENYKVAKKYCGFISNPEGRSEGTFTDFASIDDKAFGFYSYLGFIKFGLGRATSDAAREIWNENISRDEGVELVHKYDGEFPSKYLQDFLDYMEINNDAFNVIVDKFRRSLIWRKDNGEWKLHYQVPQ